MMKTNTIGFVKLKLLIPQIVLLKKKRMRLLFALLLLLLSHLANAQYGCTDAQATNYDVTALINDGSCSYAATILPVPLLTDLSTPLLDECSGLIIINGQLWTHVDNTNAAIYRIDSSSSSVLQTININATTNADWEDLAVSYDYLFVGDFGNNYGNRTNLHILRIAKNDLITSATTANADIIHFQYADQTTFIPQLNANSFDCEAFFFYDDSLHLFTKDWVKKITKHYIVPATPGTYTATLVDSFNVNGLITSAAIQSNGVITLLGYDNTGFAPCFIWMLYDYQPGHFFSGNKRMFTLGSAATLGQVEGIDFLGNNYGYISNERFQQLIFNVPPQLKSFDLSPYLPSVATVISQQTINGIIYKVFPVPSGDQLNVSINPFKKEKDYSFELIDLGGKKVLKQELSDSTTSLNISGVIPGIYMGTISLFNKSITSFRIIKN